MESKSLALALKVQEALDQPYPENLKMIMKIKGKAIAETARNIGVSFEMMKEYRNGTAPSFYIMVALAIALGLEPSEAERFLESLHFSLAGESKEVRAYRQLIALCPGKSAYEINEMLASIEIEEKHFLLPRRMATEK